MVATWNFCFWNLVLVCLFSTEATALNKSAVRHGFSRTLFNSSTQVNGSQNNEATTRHSKVTTSWHNGGLNVHVTSEDFGSDSTSVSEILASNATIIRSYSENKTKTQNPTILTSSPVLSSGTNSSIGMIPPFYHVTSITIYNR